MLNNNTKFKTELMQYIRDRHGHKLGIVLAKYFPEDNEVVVGFAKVNSKLEKFSLKRGLEIVNGRINKFRKHRNSNYFIMIPSRVAPYLDNMMHQAARYFKEATITLIPCVKHEANAIRQYLYK